MNKLTTTLIITMVFAWMTAPAVFAQKIVKATVTVSTSSVLLEQTGNTSRINWSPGEQGTVEAIGIGFPPANARTVNQGQALARRAAIVDGYRNLAEAIQGVQVDANTTVNNLAVADDVVNTKVSAMIRGAQIMREIPQADGSYMVVMSVKLYGQGSVADIAMTAIKPAQIQPFPSAGTAGGSPAEATVYTGVIIDARGMNLEPAFSPKIYDETGRVVYGNLYVDDENTAAQGLVAYALTAEMYEDAIKGNARSGSSPLVIKAIASKDNNCNVVISNSDADRLLTSNASAGFLRKCAVVCAL